MKLCYNEMQDEGVKKMKFFVVEFDNMIACTVQHKNERWGVWEEIMKNV